jgi:hypothetical protein
MGLVRAQADTMPVVPLTLTLHITGITLHTVLQAAVSMFMLLVKTFLKLNKNFRIVPSTIWL